MKRRVFVINLPHRTDRRADMERELRRVGWTVEFFPAIRPDGQGDFPSIGARGCFLSHLAVLERAREGRHAHVVILEDDANFAADFTGRWQRVEDFLGGPDWSLLYAGHALPDARDV